MKRRAGLAGGLTAAFVLAAVGAARGAPPVGAGAPAGEPVASLTSATKVYSAPTVDSGVTAVVSERRPITGEQTVLPVIARSSDPVGGLWLRVLLPGRPNGHSGWIAAASTTPGVAEWQLTVRTSTRRVMVLYKGRWAATLRAVVGSPGTPTPLGRFFVEESVQLSPDDVGAPFALALSARSNVLQEFAGGPGQIALHGVDNVGGTLGTAASHGCLRLSTRAITWLAARIAPGTPVDVVR